MSAPLRIARHPNALALGEAVSSDGRKEYVDRLLKLIPAEVVALYLAGKVQISSRFALGTPTAAGTTAPAAEQTAWYIWTIFCLGALVLVRRWATSDRNAAVPPEWVAIFFTAISFLIWVYSFGDIFSRVLHIWDPLPATLLVLGWTFVTPYLYAPNKTGSTPGSKR